MKRAIISIRPRFEGGYDVYRSDEWAGSGLALEQVRALARREARRAADAGNVGVIVTTNMRGEVQAVVEWIDPQPTVVTVADTARQVTSAHAGSPS